MKLHNDKDAFILLLTQISERTGIRVDILEKDYYVTLMLEELSQKQQTVPAYFKGGTALYKALGTIRRFSEDIDLTVEIRDCSNTQAKKRLENVSKRYSVLERTTDKNLETDKKGNITAIYDYTPVVAADTNDPLQRFRCVKVEATSFTVSEPYETDTISAAIYMNANENEKAILERNYDVKPFEVKTITLERIFADKVLAAEYYFEKEEYFDTAKHIYDIAVMIEQPRIKALLANKEQLGKMIAFKRDEEQRRFGSDLSVKPFSEYKIFDSIQNEELRKTFETMQNIYVFDPADRINFDAVISVIQGLQEVFFEQDRTFIESEVHDAERVYSMEDTDDEEIEQDEGMTMMF